MLIIEFFRTQFHTLRRFKLAALLNIFGLSVSFVVFIISMIQLHYEYTFNRSIPESERIYRLEVNQSGDLRAIVPRPLMELFAKSSSHIKEYGLKYSSTKQISLSIDQASSDRAIGGTFQTIDPSFLKTMNFRFIEGSSDQMAGNQVVLSDSTAYRLFGDQPAVGKSFYADNNTWQVAAVYKTVSGRTFLRDHVIYNAISPNQDLQEWSNSNYHFYVKLDDPKYAEEIADEFTRFFIKNKFWWEDVSFRLTSLNDLYYVTGVRADDCPEKGNKTTSLVLFLIAWLILSIATINFMNFSMALAPVRIKSINTQKIMGDSNLSLRLSLICESVILSLFSFVTALILVQLISHTSLNAMFLTDIYLQNHLPILLFTAVIASIAGVAAALYPAIYMTSFSPALALSGSFILTPLGRNFRNLLIGFQYFISVILLCMALLINIQNRHLLQTPLGFDSSQVLVVAPQNNEWRGQDAYCFEELRKGAGIEEVAGSSSLLLNSKEEYNVVGISTGSDSVFDHTPIIVSHTFLEVLGIKLTEGVGFKDPSLDQNMVVHFIFNESSKAEQGLKLGDKITFWGNAGDIIGFFPDIQYLSSRKKQHPMAFLNGPSFYSTYNIYIRVAPGANLTEVRQYIEATLNKVFPGFRFEIRQFDQAMEQLYQKELKAGTIITLFSLIVVLISVAGVFGLVLFESRTRRKEIGLRKINGAMVHEIITLFNKTYFIILGISSVIALPVAWIGAQYWLEQFKDRTPLLGWIFVLSVLLLSLITILTVTFQCWRTATANPVESIKNE